MKSVWKGLFAAGVLLAVTQEGFAMAEIEPVAKINPKTGCWEYNDMAKYIVVPVAKTGTRVFILTAGDPPKLKYTGPSQMKATFNKAEGRWLKTRPLPEAGAYTLTEGDDESLPSVHMNLTICLRMGDKL